MEGYIKDYRKIMDWEHYKDIYTYKLFQHLKYLANIKNIKYMGQIIPRGSLVIKENSIGNDCGLTYQEVRTALKKLINSGEITKKSTNKFTVINIVNYEFYQDKKSNTNEQSTNNQRTINELLTNIEEEGKESKEIKNKDICPAKPSKSKKFIKPTVDDIATYCTKRNNGLDAQLIFDHYEANNWYRGKTKISDWMACVRTWEKGQNNNQVYKKPTFKNFSEREIDFDEFERLEREQIKNRAKGD